MGKSIGIILFTDFETLDVYGPIGLIGTNMVDDFYNVTLIAPTTTEIISPTSKIPTLTTMTLDQALTQHWDVILLPGGIGFELLLEDSTFLDKLRELVSKCDIMFTVCTGSLVLAATGLLDGVHATTNKMLYCEWTPKFPKVDWVHVARWTHDGKYLCSSGVSAGMVTIPVNISVLILVGRSTIFDGDSIFTGNCRALREGCGIYLE
jgi:transcriptional regulator GlxA family with amidase domain